MPLFTASVEMEIKFLSSSGNAFVVDMLSDANSFIFANKMNLKTIFKQLFQHFHLQNYGLDWNLCKFHMAFRVIGGLCNISYKKESCIEKLIELNGMRRTILIMSWLNLLSAFSTAEYH